MYQKSHDLLFIFVLLLFFNNSNRMLTVTSGQATLIPSMDEGRTNVVNCNPLFSGVKYCTTVRYNLAGDNAAAPYFPLNGETK